MGKKVRFKSRLLRECLFWWLYLKCSIDFVFNVFTSSKVSFDFFTIYFDLFFATEKNSLLNFKTSKLIEPFTASHNLNPLEEREKKILKVARLNVPFRFSFTLHVHFLWFNDRLHWFMFTNCSFLLVALHNFLFNILIFALMVFFLVSLR